MQHQKQLIQDGKTSRILPPPNAEVLPGICWGRAETLFTPAFWVASLWLDRRRKICITSKLPASNLREEVAGCILGGFGITLEMNKAAFCMLKRNGIFETEVACPEEIAKLLKEPLKIGARKARYRFPQQKARYIAKALEQLKGISISSLKDVAFRNALTTLPGIGFKTASWIVRNARGSDEVAIIDVHIHRAGLIFGLFNETQSPSKDYLEMEARFLEFARKLSVSAAALDLTIWEGMRLAGSTGIAASREF